MLMSALKPLGELENTAEFAARHIGPYADDETHMLSVIGAASRRALSPISPKATCVCSKPLWSTPIRFACCSHRCSVTTRR